MTMDKMNLIICASPLQVLIAEKIIALYPEDTFFGVMVAGVNNNKYRYYFSRLQQHCKESQYIVEPKEYGGILRGKLRKIYYFYRVKKQFVLTRTTFDKVFISNINSSIFQILLSGAEFDTLMTFDDGLANILPNSVCWQDSRQRKRCWPCKNNYSYDTLRHLSCKHYSIYPNYKNIVAPVVAINLAEPIMVNSNTISVTKEPIRILLGQPLLEPDWDQCKEIAQQLAEHWQITYYFPHPRECYVPDQVKIIETDLIFEEYLLTEISKTPDTQYEIYSMGSSAMLNVINFPNVTVKLIQVIGIEQQVHWYQDLLHLLADLHVETLTFSLR